MKLKSILFFVSCTLLFFTLGIPTLLSDLKSGIIIKPTINPYVQRVAKNSPGEREGIQTGDEVVGVNNKPVADFYTQILEKPLSETTLTTKRNNTEILISFKEGKYTHFSGSLLGLEVYRQRKQNANSVEITLNHFKRIFTINYKNTLLIPQQGAIILARILILLLAVCLPFLSHFMNASPIPHPGKLKTVHK